MPTTYSWDLIAAPLNLSFPNPGTLVPSTPARNDRLKEQFARGIRFANVPLGRADLVIHGGPRVWHINTLATIQNGPGDVLTTNGMYSGVIKFRFRDHRRYPVPDSVNRPEYRSIDQFSNPVFSSTR